MHRSLAAAVVAALLIAAPAAAQEDHGKLEREIAQLEALLAKVDAAIAALEPVIDPPVRLVQYDVRHLLWQPADRYGPRLGVSAAASGWRVAGAQGVWQYDDEVEGDHLDPDYLFELVQNAVGDAWDEPHRMDLHRGYLLVWQTDVAQARIARLLDGLRKRATRAVQLEVDFYRLDGDAVAALDLAAAQAGGVLGPDALGALDAVADRDPKVRVGTALLTALDGQRVFLHRGQERAFLAGYHRMSGGTGNHVEQVDDPDVDDLVTGLVLEVRPTIVGGDDPRVALDVEVGRAEVTAVAQQETPWGPLSIPGLETDSVRTAARIPAGAGMLVSASLAEGSADGAQLVVIVRPAVLRAE